MTPLTIEIICLSVAAITFVIGAVFHYKGKPEPEFYFSVSTIAVLVFGATIFLTFMASHPNG